MKQLKSNLRTEKVLETIPFINQMGLNNLSNSGRIKRKKFGKSFQYDRSSIHSFLHSFNIDKYKTVSETTEILNNNGIRDIFQFFGNENGKKKCRYIRFTKEFPMSVKNLIKNGYLEIDKDIKPTLIKYESIISTIKYFTNSKVSHKPINNIVSVDSFLKKVG